MIELLTSAAVAKRFREPMFTRITMHRILDHAWPVPDDGAFADFLDALDARDPAPAARLEVSSGR